LDETRLGIGRALNIHPAITRESSPFQARGKTPTADVLARANQNALSQENGPHTWTGATFHVMNQEIDDGPLVADGATTPVYAGDDPMQLRARIYENGKIPVFLAGLRYYVERLHPNLPNLDWNRLREDSNFISREAVNF